ncbi:MAG: DNA polymerase I [Eubacteriales bacterium]|nr:DNA polymerase I [Eubacteriales bacterium]
MGKLVLIDGHSILNRAFYGVPELTNSEGLHTNAVYGFLNIMFKILEEEEADHLAVAFDLKEPTFRHKQFADYKGTRKPMPQELHEQVGLMKEVLASMGVPIMTLPGYEADDILGTVAKRSAADGVEVSVVSGDRDLLQLSDTHIKIRIPKTSKGKTEIYDYYPEDVKREYQVTPVEFIDVKALMGDSSDNIPGVPSIGEKTATSLIVAYGSIENAYAHLNELKPPRAQKALAEHYDMAVMSKELATICIDCPIEFSYEDAEIGNLYTPEAYQYMKRLEFKSILARFDVADMGGASVEENFWSIDDLAGAEQLFERAAGAEQVGFQLITELGTVKGLALCFGEEECYAVPATGFITGAYLCDKVNDLVAKRKTSVENGHANQTDHSQMDHSPAEGRPEDYSFGVLDLKSQLPYLNLDYGSPVVDLGVAGYLLNPLKDTYAYDDLARDYLGMTVPSKADLLGKQSLAAALLEGDQKAVNCVCYMGYIAWKAMGALKEKLEQDGMLELFLTMEMPLIYSLYHMEQAGIRVDREQLKEYGDRLKVRIAKLEQEIYDLAGETFNINSPKQLGEILFERMELPHGKKTKTGYSTAADVLEKLAPEYPIVQMILDYRQLTKLNSTYAEGLAVYIGEDERIHGRFNQTITATGRISSTEPNLQNIPVRMELGREIRKVFVPEDGCVFVDADYSQIELRILAHMSEDERLISAYRDAQDIHAITASEVFHTPLDQVTPLQRRNAKAVNFGIVYGISAFGLSEDLSISRKEALEYINKYFETYPGVKTFLDKQVEDGKSQGYVTSMFGRRRPIPELKSGNFMQRSFGERVAMNSPIQGTAADIMKIAMIAVDQELRARGLRSRIVLQVHDELLVETRKEELEEVTALLTDKMKHAANLKVALEVEAHSGASWLDAK